MFPYEFYKWLHLVGLVITFVGLGGLVFAFAQGGPQKKLRAIGFAMHGTGLLILLVAGFGLAARLGYMSGLPMWVWAKLVIWFLVGAAVALIKRKPGNPGFAIVFVCGLAALAAYLAVFKPF